MAFGMDSLVGWGPLTRFITFIVLPSEFWSLFNVSEKGRLLKIEIDPLH